MRWRNWLAGLLLLSAWCGAGGALAALATSKHNLSASGPGTVKAAGEAQVCIFCHAPHNSSPTAPLWNRRTPGGSYVPYSSSTAKANAGQPTGASLLCLSCHDGTIALGDVLNRASTITMAGGVTTMPAGSASNLGTDLSGDHPVSIPYTAALAATRGELVAPSTLTGRVISSTNIERRNAPSRALKTQTRALPESATNNSPEGDTQIPWGSSNGRGASAGIWMKRQ